MHLRNGWAFAWCAFALWAAKTAGDAMSYYLQAAPRFRLESAWMILLAGGLALAARSLRAAPARGEEPGRPIGTPRRWLAPACFLAAAVALYWNALSLGLLSDDFIFTARAREGAWWTPGEWEFFRPLAAAWWRAVTVSTLPLAGTLHATNILLHAANATMVWHLAGRMGLGRSAAILAGALFLVFPASAEAVAWASGVQNTAMVTACLLLCAMAASPQPGPWQLPLAAACVAAGLGFKETAVAMPLLGLAAAAASGPRIPWKPLALASLLIAAYGLWRWAAGDVPPEHLTPPTRYALKELLVRPFATLGSPFTADETRRLPYAALALGLAHIAGFVLLVRRLAASRRGGLTLVALLGWVLASVAPVYSFLFVADDLQGSRYLYLASAAWAILLAWVLDWSGRAGLARTTAVVASCALIAIWAAAAHHHLADWQRAAAERDRVLADVRTQLAGKACAVVAVRGAPDSVGGAYVFRNGLGEALLEAGVLGPGQALGAAPERCTVDLRALR